MNETAQYAGADMPVSNSRILSLTEEAYKMVASLEHILAPVLTQVLDKPTSVSADNNESEAALALEGLCRRLSELQSRIKI